MTNRGGIPLEGEIKAVWHRTFTGEFYPVRYNDGSVWSDEIGRMPIHMASTTKKYEGKILCNILINRIYPKKYSPQISFYYRAEGSDTWMLMRNDSDSELQRWKGADEGKIVNGSEERPELSWGVRGGYNYQYINLE